MTSKRDQPMHDGRGDDEAELVADGGADVGTPDGDLVDGAGVPENVETAGETREFESADEWGLEPEADPHGEPPDDDADEVEDDVEEWGVEPEDAYYDEGEFDDEDVEDGVPAPVVSDDSPDVDDDPKRSRAGKNRLRAVLAAVLVGGVAAGGVLYATGGFDDLGEVGSSVIGDKALPQNDFTRSEAGDCLTWTADAPGDPVTVECTKPHRFEVAGVLDTSTFPTAEFASTAPFPTPERFAEIRDENCSVIVSRYLGGALDPQGRFAPGLMFPSESEWQQGVRSLRCGIEQPGVGGVQDEFTGRVRDVDQSFTWADGSCIGIDAKSRQPTGAVVNCAEPHAFQVTGSVDMSQRFGGRTSGKPWPSVNDQNEYLRGICPNRTNRFFGGAEKFKQTTLNVQPSVLSEVSWLTGSRRVFCYVALPDRGGFATLVGDAREGPLLINGKVPTPPNEGPPGRSVGEPVPLPPGYTPSDQEPAAPVGG
ncbi:septum formation family protein [Gordonia phthalatica]|uniref:Septum formation-related domain-containing protein n=1 Tax=Gordonia phthalatica TaxID=1136941 RepID=A0A0N9N6E9_9ACTN|nr:septum formation family protein [Gordonia phthalatica]ALG83355.1 hypothetical protein ACH46_01055 [Gordonia phthalatica]